MENTHIRKLKICKFAVLDPADGASVSRLVHTSALFKLTGNDIHWCPNGVNEHPDIKLPALRKRGACCTPTHNQVYKKMKSGSAPKTLATHAAGRHAHQGGPCQKNSVRPLLQCSPLSPARSARPHNTTFSPSLRIFASHLLPRWAKTKIPPASPLYPSTQKGPGTAQKSVLSPR